MEIYALGGYGAGRKQVKVTNQFDTCCFAGTFPNSYRQIVTDKVASLGAGEWQHVLDSTHHQHQISSNAISTVINPAFGITNPAPSPRRLPQIEGFDDQTSGMPTGWSVDPSSSGGTTATENGGRVTIQGSGLASIVHNAPINVQTGRPVTLSIGIASMSADNFAGVFFTDNIGSRAFHIGPLFNASTKQFALNADNGQGFNGNVDRVVMTTIPAYTGGKAVMSLTFDATGFTMEFAPDGAAKYSSGKQPWSRVPGGFNPTKLGDYSQLFIQSFDTDGGTAANIVVDYVTVTGQTIPGDFNGDNRVDAADYIVWRDNRGKTGPPGILGDGDDGSGTGKPDGSVNDADYSLWRANFGQTQTAASTSLAVPEPTNAVVLQLFAFLLMASRSGTGGTFGI
jgi:hypothetical protein